MQLLISSVLKILCVAYWFAITTRPLAWVLKSRILRRTAGFRSYFDKSLATEDAVQIGSAHCEMPTWERASVDFLRSGGFLVANNVGKVQQDSLLIWGKNDEILNPNFPEKFQAAMGERLRSTYYLEECGHVPHLEKPLETAQAIKHFIDSS